MRLMRRLHAPLMLAAILSACSSIAAVAEDFYRGKTVTMVVGFQPGGGIDTSARIIARHIVRFIPGAPNIIIQTVDGAAGVVAANYLEKRASRDGLTIAVPGRSWFMEPMLKNPNAQFDPLTLGYVGSTGTMNSQVWVNANSGYTNLRDFMSAPEPVVFGALGAGTQTAMVAAMMKENGAPIKLVSGYPGSARLLLALQQGEVSAVFLTEDSFLLHKDLITQKKILPILQSRPVAPGIPLVSSAIAPAMLPVLELATSGETMGVLVVTPPDVPAERLGILRAAFMAMTNDGEYQAEAARFETTHVTPFEGARVAMMMRELAASATPRVVAEFNRLKR